MNDRNLETRQGYVKYRQASRNQPVTDYHHRYPDNPLE
ncbi:MAG: hypothetical protein JWN00_1721 [Actinomycetia bacterium]|nr:hypothetical protein [Actinomycetes bacterium]